MSNNEDVLYSKLIGVKDSYDDFIIATFSFSKYYGIVNELIEYLESHPGASSSEVISERFRLAYGATV